ncbi:MAG TPA: hypothetical protein VJN50_03600 [Actinomycetota bacterium]|nr:hypothetical protein [Actinomycetota bacterium]
MERETTLLIALAMLFVAGLTVAAGGWILFARDRRAHRSVTAETHHEAPEEP